LVGALKSYAELREDLSKKYKLEEADTIDWAAMLERRKRLWGSIARALYRSYWRDRACVRQCRKDGTFPAVHEVTGDLEHLVGMCRAREQLEASRALGERFFGSAWKGLNSRLDVIASLAEWLPRYRKCCAHGGIGAKAGHLTEDGADRTQLTAQHQELERAVKTWEADSSSLLKLVQADEADMWGRPVREVPLGQVRDRLQRMSEGIEVLVDWSQYQDGLQACEKGPLAEFVSKALAMGVQPDAISRAMEKQFLDTWLNDMLAQRPEIRRFNARTHETDQYDFATLDKRWIGQSGARLCACLAAQRPANSDTYAESSQMGILCGEIRRKRGGKSIRRLLLDARDAIQRIKPCFMMSPLSVAQFIDPAGMKFDVIVFDEASQVEPADALGAIARGKQLILVGDPKQLPPTRFFAGLTGEGDPQDSDKTAGIADMESILDKGLSVLPKTTLRWHYRSKHESLIAFSNREFYNNKLVVFPSSHSDKKQIGLSMEYTGEDMYDRGKSQTNRGQARRIAKYVLEHAKHESGKSLGVGAFSQRQQQAILDEIERLRREDGTAEEFFDVNRPEAFFVKNLETIQGDERDVILLSVGYGRTFEDQRISMNFGPLNQDGGWRRLNVLVTRAREKCVVFSSIRGDDLDVSGTSARGVHALKGYLDYARTGQLPEIKVGAQGNFDSDFEEAVYNALVEKGLTLHTQVGCAGYAIDLAVVDPEKPGRYLLGIECDGATYHGSETARDRDRLRQQVLEGLGWRIHRIWSTEWLNKPQSEVERALETVQKAQAGLLEPRYAEVSMAADPPVSTPPSESEAVQEPEIAPEVLVGVEPYKCYVPQRIRSSDAFYAGSMQALAQLVREVVAAEGPIHEDELARRVAACYGMSRVGNKIATRVQQATIYASTQYGVVCKGKFLWSASVAEPCIRSRVGEGPRDIELICPEEIGLAARLLLKAQFGMHRHDLVVQTARVLGFNNTGSSIATAVEAVLEGEITAGRIRADGDSLLAV
jgi:very-short-patch-repair endonuclease